VFGYTQGAYGEQVIAKPVHVLPLPDALSFDQGAGASCYFTAYHACIKRVSCRALRDVSDELRGTCGAWEIKGWYTPAPSRYNPLLIALVCTLGEWLLVLAAAGGVGMAAIQIGKGTNRSTHFNVLLTSSRLNLGVLYSTRSAGHRLCIAF
jgi:NADPH:quinone reductase-like Zn-dependent oxidoreductase